MSEDQPQAEQLVEKPGPEDQRLWSVTTIIGASSSNRGLIEWAASETAKAAIENLSVIQAMAREDPNAAVEWLRGARERPRKGQRTAKQLGTEIHAACEAYALTGEPPAVDEEIQPFLDQFRDWCERFQPEYEAAEMTIFHPGYGYAGTLDAVLKIGGQRVITDYKTSRRDTDDRGRPRSPWPDVSLQLAAYRHAEFAGPFPTRRYSYYGRRYYLLNPEEVVEAVPVPDVDGGLCLYLTPERCEAYPVRCDEEIFDAFCFAIERARWSLETQRGVLGDPLQAPVREAA